MQTSFLVAGLKLTSSAWQMHSRTCNAKYCTSSLLLSPDKEGRLRVVVVVVGGVGGGGWRGDALVLWGEFLTTSHKEIH